MAFLVSPGVNTSEIDLTTSVPGVGTTTGGTVGFFRWGPANTVVQVTSESDLAEKFFKPDGNSALSFMSAANFQVHRRTWGPRRIRYFRHQSRAWSDLFRGRSGFRPARCSQSQR